MDQADAPLLTALAARTAERLAGFGAPGHGGGAAMPEGMRAALGRRVFAADLLTPKGLDDRTESGHVLQRAHEIAAEAWGADLCRFSTGGSTQSLHTALAAVARPGETVLIARNAHKAEYAAALTAGLDLVPIPCAIDPAWGIEHGVTAAAMAHALADHPHAKAVVVVSPTYYGVTSNVAELARLAHARGVPLIVDGAWGAAFGFSPRLPRNPLLDGADILVGSLHKTMGALAQGSVLLARGDRVDQERLALAYELFETTSPSVPILASADATRREHALHGARLWEGILDLAEEARAGVSRIDGLRVLEADCLDGDGAFDFDRSKLLVDVSALGVAGYAADDWLYARHKVGIGLADGRHLLAVMGPGTPRAHVRRLVRGLAALARAVRETPGALPRAPADLPEPGTLGFERAMAAPDAFFAAAEKVRYEEAEGRIAAEVIAPAPPGIPRLIPGQRISAAHVRFLVAHRDAGMFVLDPTDPSERRLRVVR